MSGLSIDVLQAAGEVRSALAARAPEAVELLRELADRYAVTRRLAHQALLLQRDAKRLPPDRRPELNQRVLQLLDEVLKDYGNRAESEDAIQRQAALVKARELVRKKQPTRGLALAAEGLGKTYRKGTFSLDEVSLDLRLGEITAVVGRNANGKTTLFRLIAGELRHDRGRLWYPMADQGPNDEIDWVRVKDRMAYVPQELPKWYGSLRNNLHYEAALRGIRAKENEEEVEYIVERLGLGEHAEKKWEQLSGGFKLRFALARALVWKPKLLLLDEPLAHLDYITVEIVLKDLVALANSYRYPLAILVSSQHLHEIEAVADNILFLRNGKVVYNGPASEVGRERKENVFELRCDDAAKLKSVLQGLPFHQLRHTGLAHIVRTSLDLNARALLDRLVNAGIEVKYFRDISNSTKQLFDSAE